MSQKSPLLIQNQVLGNYTDLPDKLKMNGFEVVMTSEEPSTSEV
jgi:hypothetical protein